MSQELLQLLSSADLAFIDDFAPSLYTNEINGKVIENSDTLRLFIEFMERSIHGGLIESDLLNIEDFRNAMFVRIEISVATYYHSIRQSKKYFKDIINDSLELGYSLKFSFGLAAGEREVQFRIAFLDRYFYNIDHFIQIMNREFGFASTDNTKRKQQVFTEMLKYFKLEDKFFTPKRIFDIFSEDVKVKNYEFIELLRDNSDRSIKYTDLYEYIANIRNSLHSNGFSNKTMNNLSLGELKYEIRKGKFLKCISLTHLVALLIPMTKILEEIVRKSIELKPECLADPFRQEVNAFLEKVK